MKYGKVEYEIGMRVVGQFSRDLGTVVALTSAGPRVRWDGERDEDALVYHPQLHVSPLIREEPHIERGND